MRLIFSIIFLALGIFVFGQRTEFTINSSWQFKLENSSHTEIVNLPHTWNDKDPFIGDGKYFRGKGVYRKKLFIPKNLENKNIYIRFEGANQITRVWLNDTYIGDHKGGYTGFVFNVSKQIRPGEMNNFKVEVDNSHNIAIPPLEADFNFYGGIYRDVSILVTSGLHFDIENEAVGQMKISTSNVTKQNADIKIEVVIRNETTSTQKTQLRLKLINPNGKIYKTLYQKIKLHSGDISPILFETKIDNPDLWSPDSPTLYKAELSILDEQNNTVTDSISSTFGCRWFNIDPEKGLYLNGKPIKLIGVNRHQDYERLGNALPNAIHQKDYRLIKEMGCNFVRIAHYPHDPEAYRLCDKLGLLVWSEIPIINEITNSEDFTENCLQMQREHIQQFCNHPSVMMWGYMNEIFLRMTFTRDLAEDKKDEIISSTTNLAQQLDKLSHDLDPERLTVMALHNNQIYNTTGIADIPDVIGWNLYFGWYDGKLEDLGNFLDKQHQQYPQRPILISEYGPGADTRIQTDKPLPWDYSEAYQLESHRSYYKQLMERSYILGMAAWNFADFGSSGRQDAKPFINQKGLLNFDRTPKNVYHYYQALLLSEPYIYIEDKGGEKHFCEGSKSGIANYKVTVFSNQSEVQLIIDDTLKYKTAVIEGMAYFNIELSEGKHFLVAQSGRSSHRQEIELILRSTILLNLDKESLCINVGTHCDFYDPLTKETWVHDQPYEAGGWGHIGGSDYQRSKGKYQGTPINIKGTHNDPLFQTMREGLSEYRFDVEQGTYRITLYMVEPNNNANNDLIYNLNTNKINTLRPVREFDVLVNEEIVLENINPARDFGVGQAIENSFEVKTEDDLVIHFKSISGEPILSGIKLERLGL